MSDENDIARVVIKDANIIFDFWELDLMDQFLKIDYAIYVTGLVQNEIKDDGQKNLFRTYVDAKLIIIDNGDLDRIVDLMSNNSGCSIEDCSVLEFGLRTGAIVLTNDGPLRVAVESNGLECHGLLWCIDVMVQKKLITWDVGKEKVEEWMNGNERTPKELCEKFMKELEDKYGED